MLIVADTHVHVYRGYDAAAALHHGVHNLTGLARRCSDGQALENTLLALFLAEAEGCRFFDDVRRGIMKDQLPGWSIEPAGDEGAVWVEAPVGDAPDAADPGPPGPRRLLLVAGRQLVTRERLEVLALATDAAMPRVPDLEDAIAAVHEAGGVPVLSWAPGKWSFQRGERVTSIIDASSPDQLLFGDSSLRARATEPDLMLRARQRGFKVVAGSDPLPIGGEERILGSYGTAWHGEVEMDRPLSSLRPMLLDPSVTAAVVGERSTGLGVVSRLVRHTIAKRLGSKKSAAGEIEGENG
jgi:hypothetical protein